MNDPLILILVLIASAVSITGLVLLNRWLGGWQPARLESPAGAATCLSNDIVGFCAGETVLFDQGTGAFVMEQGGDRLGHGLLVRVLHRTRLRDDHTAVA